MIIIIYRVLYHIRQITSIHYVYIYIYILNICSDRFCSHKGCSDFFSLSKQNGQFKEGGGETL